MSWFVESILLNQKWKFSIKVCVATLTVSTKSLLIGFTHCFYQRDRNTTIPWIPITHSNLSNLIIYHISKLQIKEVKDTSTNIVLEPVSLVQQYISSAKISRERLSSSISGRVCQNPKNDKNAYIYTMGIATSWLSMCEGMGIKCILLSPCVHSPVMCLSDLNCAMSSWIFFHVVGIKFPCVIVQSTRAITIHLFPHRGKLTSTSWLSKVDCWLWLSLIF